MYPGKDDITEMIDFLTEEGKCSIQSSELEMKLLSMTLNQLKIRIQQIVSGQEFKSNLNENFVSNQGMIPDELIESKITNKKPPE